MRELAGRILAAGVIGCVFGSAFVILITGVRSKLSDWFAAIAVLIMALLIGIATLSPQPKTDPLTHNADDRRASFTTLAAMFLGWASLGLIYRGGFQDYQQLVAGFSCVMTALGSAMSAATQFKRMK